MKKSKKEFKINYNAIIESIDKHSQKIIKRVEIHNAIVNNGLNLVRDWMASESVENPKAIAIGTDDTTVDNADTELGAEVLRSAATITKPASYQVRYYHLFVVGSGVSYNIKEVGICDSIIVSGSTLFSHLNCDNVLDADTNLAVTVTYTIARV